MKKYPEISVCMPVYNREDYINECIDSILHQSFQNFEIIIVDDGSTDNTCALIESYQDSRIKLVKNRHNYIESTNLLFELAQGKYIARIDSDDIMLPKRLETQYSFLEKHPEIDILGGGYETFGQESKVYPPQKSGDLDMYDFLEGCCIAHPTVMMRKERIKSFSLKYEADFIYAEDYRFWTQALLCRLKLYNLSDTLIKYRCSQSQVTHVNRPLQEKASRKVRECLMGQLHEKLKTDIRLNASQGVLREGLTAIIVFYNEKEEVRNTICSIFDTIEDSVAILVINDCSDDNYDYDRDFKDLNIQYIKNSFRMGSSASKEKGVQCCQTTHFILLDAHMRFYQKGWNIMLLEELRRNPEALMCCQTKVLKKENNGDVTIQKSKKCYGAFVNFGTHSLMPSTTWNAYPTLLIKQTGYIPCILGASYCASKEYWNRIGGLQGLIGYGCEEPFLSMKVWLSGGYCKLMESIEIGHIYKTTSPYVNRNAQMLYNHLFIAETLFPYEYKCRAFATAAHLHPDAYAVAKDLLKGSEEPIRNVRNIMKNLEVRDFEFIEKLNCQYSQDQLEDVEHRMQDIQHIVDFNTNQYVMSESLGLYDGNAGLTLLLCLYDKFTGKDLYDRLASKLFTKICEEIHPDKMAMTFKNGMMGIGWTLLYLADHSFIQPEDIQEEIRKIDQNISILNPKSYRDGSFEYGLTGLASYCIARISFGHRHHIPPAFSEYFFKDLQDACDQFLKNNRKQLDIQSMSILMQIVHYNPDITIRFNKLNIDHYLRLSKFLPRNSSFWKKGVEGCMGYGINILNKYLYYHENQQIHIH